MLGLVVLAPGCATSKMSVSSPSRDDRSDRISALSAEPTPQHRAAPEPVDPAADRRRRRTDQPAGDDPEARAAPVEPTAEPIYTDPGARWLVQRIATAIEGEAGAAADQPIRIDVTAIRNQSRVQSDEFEGMLQRLADLLDRAARDEKLEFTADPAAPSKYRIKGTAYMLNAGGFDQWELYLSLVPVEQAWTVWSADVPIRLLRASRPRSQQIFPLTGSR